MIMFCL
jgi:hypothetical protein